MTYIYCMRQKESKSIDPEIKELVIARLSTIPPHIKISIGDYGDVSVHEAIDHIKSNDEIGQRFIEIEMKYLQALKKGIFSF